METKRMESQWRLFGMALCAIGTACADVATNVWQSLSGGNWYATNEVGNLANWEGGFAYTNFPTNAIAQFRLADKAQVYVDRYECAKNQWFVPYFGGFDVASADDAPVDASWTFVLGNNTRPDLVVADAGLGYTPFHVANGTLSFNSNLDEASSGFAGFHTKPYWTVRKTGEGTLRLGAFVYQQDMRTVLEVSAGDVRPTANAALAFTDVQVVESGSLTLDAAAPAAHVGSLTVSNGTSVALNGAELVLGGLGASALDAAVTGSGRVTATVDDLVVTNPVAGIEYGAVAGRLRLDTADGLALPFARYGFENSLTTDDSGQNRTLVPFGADGTVTRVWDEERNSYVARFNGAAGGLTVSVPDGGRLAGDADYTVSLWAKVAQIPARNEKPTLFTLGESTVDRQLVQGRFTDANCSSMVFGHWCGAGDFTDVPASSSPMAWHHYVFQRLGGRCTVWVDGVVTFEKEATLVLALSEKSIFTLGSYPEGALSSFPRSFHGDIDDVRVYSSAVGAAGARRLYAGLEPFAQAGRPAASDTAPELPDGLRLRTALNGEILLGGGAVVSNVLGDAQRGGLVLPKGGTLTMTGPGRYDAGVAGATDFEKAGAGTLTVGGNLSHTGVTKVAAGTLRLASWATMPALHAAYDFEESLTHDAGPDAVDFDHVAEVARVWDEDRRSFVAEFPGTQSQRLCIDSYTRASLYGDSDYTISVWVKPAEGCSSEGTFLSLGPAAPFQQIVFRYRAGGLVLSHWGKLYDYTDIPAEQDSPGTWHHYVATRCGKVFTVYRDGTQIWTRDTPVEGSDSPALLLPAQRTLHLGLQSNNSARCFKGRIDDVRIYATALDAAAVARLHQGEEPTVVPRGADPTAVVVAPAPVSRWSFENADDLGHDTMGRHPLTKERPPQAKEWEGVLTLVDSPLGGKALRFPDAIGTATAWLRTTGGTFRPAGANRPFSVSMWVQTSSGDQDASGQRPYFLYLGKPSEIGYMFGFWHDRNDFAWSLRDVLVKRQHETWAETSMDVCSRLAVRGLHESDAALRWHHYAKVYDPELGFLSYVDGQFQPDMSRLHNGIACRDMTDMDLYLGIRPDKPNLAFRGAIDEVRFYDCVLSGADVRAIMREDQTRGLAALPPGTAVDVASGATLDVNGTDETVAALTGEGTVALSSGRLAVTGTTTFDGVLSGAGTVRLPEGGALTLTKVPTAFTGYFEMAGGELKLNLPENAQLPNATFRVCVLDGTKQVSYPGEVELPDGLNILLTADNAGPFVTAVGRIVVAGGGTVVLPDGKTTGTWVIARGTSAVASEAALASWRVTNAPASVRTAFQTTASGDFVCRVFGQGTCVILR